MMATLPVLAMSDRRDISSLLDSANVGKTATKLLPASWQQVACSGPYSDELSFLYGYLPVHAKG